MTVPPAAATLKPVRLPIVRDRLVRHWGEQPLARTALLNAPPSFRCWLPGADLGQPEEFAVMVKGAAPPQAIESFCTHIAAGLADCDLYWVANRFGELAVNAAVDLTDLTLMPDFLPSPAGMIVYEGPIWENMWAVDEVRGQSMYVAGVTDVEAISWFTTDLGVWVTMYVRPEKQIAGVPIKRLRDQIGFLLAHSPGGGFPFGTHHDISQQSPVMAILLSTWLLLRQPGVAEVTDAPRDMSVLRKYDRAGRPAPQVRIVNLRRRPVPEGREPAGDRVGRKLENQQLVHGHWKEQAYGPGRTLRRPHYVDDYLRGPEDAPFKPTTPVVKKLA